MKKMMMLAAMAMMAVTAQAITTGWHNATVTADTTTPTNYAVSGIHANVDKIWITATLTVTSIDNWNNSYATAPNTPIIAYAPENSSASKIDRHPNGLIVFSDTKIGTLLHTGDTSKSWGPNMSGTMQVGTYEISMLFTRKDDNNWTVNSGDISWTIGETKWAPGHNNVNISDANLGLADGTLNLYTSDEEALKVSNLAVAYTIPEPTALALLALGVAGLALKRKMK